MNHSPLRSFLLIPFVLACFALSPHVRATCQEGCFTNSNTILGDDALLNNAGVNNTAIGFNALLSNATGAGNTATGYQALFSNTDGIGNTANGLLALYSNTGGAFNTATGDLALLSNTTGYDNTAYGTSALYSNTTGFANTATGYLALNYNTTGTENTAMGWYCLSFSTTGLSNTAVGSIALEFNSTGSKNTAVGVSALMGLGGAVTGNSNTATGVEALSRNTTGSYNTATGGDALLSNTIGNKNTAIGFDALYHNTTGHSNIALGGNAGFNLTTGSHNIDIGNPGIVAEANTIRIGGVGIQTATFIAGISGATVPTGVAVIIDSTGHLGTTTSSARFKDAIKPMDKASEAILALKPVTFRYKQELDPEGIPQFGLVAEQVEKVDPDLVARDEQGKAYTVRYEAVNAMLLNEFLKEHREVQEQKAAIVEFKNQIANLAETVKQQSAQIQKVNAQLEASKPAPQVVLNP